MHGPGRHAHRVDSDISREMGLTTRSSLSHSHCGFTQVRLLHGQRTAQPHPVSSVELTDQPLHITPNQINTSLKTQCVIDLPGNTWRESANANGLVLGGGAARGCAPVGVYLAPLKRAYPSTGSVELVSGRLWALRLGFLKMPRQRS